MIGGPSGHNHQTPRYGSVPVAFNGGLCHDAPSSVMKRLDLVAQKEICAQGEGLVCKRLIKC